MFIPEDDDDYYESGNESGNEDESFTEQAAQHAVNAAIKLYKLSQDCFETTKKITDKLSAKKSEESSSVPHSFGYQDPDDPGFKKFAHKMYLELQEKAAATRAAKEEADAAIKALKEAESTEHGFKRLTKSDRRTTMENIGKKGGRRRKTKKLKNNLKPSLK